MIDAANPVLCQRPETINGLSVIVAHHVNFLGVLDALVLLAVRVHPQLVIDRIVVRIHSALWHDALRDNRKDRTGLRIRCDIGQNFSAALNHAEHRSLVIIVASAHPAIAVLVLALPPK
jgi:hypothetical protein